MPVKTNPTDPLPVLPWPRLQSGRLLRRYKRFLADVELDDGRVVTAHCPNSGRMTSCCTPGRAVYISRSDNPRRKLRYTWEMIAMPGSLVGVNTQVPNRLVAASLSAQAVAGLAGYTAVRREVATGAGCRLDMLLEADGRRRCYLEVKNCTLVEDGVARFPDAVTERGSRHLDELARLAGEGHRAVIFFLIQRMDARIFEPAGDVDPHYAHRLREVTRRGVEIHVWDVRLDMHGIGLRRPMAARRSTGTADSGLGDGAMMVNPH